MKVKSIQLAVAAHYGLQLDELLSKKRWRWAMTPRHLAMYIAREMTELSYTKLAQLFNREDHKSIISAEKKICLMMAEGKLSGEHKAIKAKLFNY